MRDSVSGSIRCRLRGDCPLVHDHTCHENHAEADHRFRAAANHWADLCYGSEADLYHDFHVDVHHNYGHAVSAADGGPTGDL